MKTSRLTALLTLLFIAATSHGAWACAACWSGSAGNDKMSKAAAVGIGAMVIIMFGMLGSILAFARHLAWRAKNPLPDYDELLADDNTLDDPESKS